MKKPFQLQSANKTLQLNRGNRKVRIKRLQWLLLKAHGMGKSTSYRLSLKNTTLCAWKALLTSHGCLFSMLWISI